MIDVRVQAADFDPGRQLARLGELRRAAVASFVGRLEASDTVTEIWIDHYPPLARAELMRIAEAAVERWSLEGAIVTHRHGRIAPFGRVLFAGVAGPGIDQATRACDWLVAEIRRCAPFWRKDMAADGSGRWR